MHCLHPGNVVLLCWAAFPFFGCGFCCFGQTHQAQQQKESPLCHCCWRWGCVNQEPAVVTEGSLGPLLPGLLQPQGLFVLRRAWERDASPLPGEEKATRVGQPELVNSAGTMALSSLQHVLVKSWRAEVGRSLVSSWGARDRGGAVSPSSLAWGTCARAHPLQCQLTLVPVQGPEAHSKSVSPCSQGSRV